jgi:hypothetical protein
MTPGSISLSPLPTVISTLSGGSLTPLFKIYTKLLGNCVCCYYYWSTKLDGSILFSKASPIGRLAKLPF